MFRQGDKVTGKWTGTAFRIDQSLGAGANGQVYLVRSPRGLAAMKVCDRSSDIAMEWGVLTRLCQTSQVFPKPMLIDDQPPDVFFYVMEWVPGRPLHEAFGQMTVEQVRDTTLQAARALAELHALGYAFCDIKPDNMLVATSPALSIRFVDVGGVTPFGRSVRQYTPFYDRGFWGCGTRKADAGYDVSGLAAAVLLSFVRPEDALMTKTPEGRQAWLHKAIRKFPYPEFQPVLRDALFGQIVDANTFGRVWSAVRVRAASPSVTWRLKGAPGQTQQSTGNHSAGPSSRSRPSGGFAGVKHRRHARKGDWTEWLMWISLTTAATVTFAAWATFLGWM